MSKIKMGQMDEDRHCGASTEQASDPPAESYVPAWLAPDGKRRTDLNLSLYRVHKDDEIKGYGPATGFSELSYRRVEGRESKTTCEKKSIDKFAPGGATGAALS